MTEQGREIGHLAPMHTQLRMARMVAERVEELGMTQVEFARRVGVTPKHVNKVFGGTSQAYMPTLDYWAFILGCRWQVELAPITEAKEGVMTRLGQCGG